VAGTGQIVVHIDDRNVATPNHRCPPQLVDSLGHNTTETPRVKGSRVRLSLTSSDVLVDHAGRLACNYRGNMGATGRQPAQRGQSA